MTRAALLGIAAALAAAAVVLAWVGFVRGAASRSQAQAAQAAIRDFAATLARFREQHGHLPGDVNRDDEIDPAEAVYVPRDVGGRTIFLRVIARRASLVPNAPRGRNVIELWGLPCPVAQELDARIDDGDLARGDLRATLAACVLAGDGDRVPVVAVALP